MSAQPLDSTSNLGLINVVKQQLEISLLALAPLWQAEPPSDWKRVVRPTGEGSFSVNIEPYRGVHSWLNFRKKIIGKDTLNSLEKIVRENQPALLGYVRHPNGSQMIQDVFSLTFMLCETVLRYTGASLSIEDAIKRVLSELDQLLTTKSATQEVITALSGLKLPEGIDRIELGESLHLRRLTAVEISDLGSNDISSETRHDITSRYVTTALISTRAIRVTLSENYEPITLDIAATQEIQDQINDVLCALHILKTGRVGVVASFTKISPTILPNMGGHSSSPLIVNPFSFMELDATEIENFIKLYKQISTNKRDELKIAAVRLVDAESRLSPVDSLLDAVIGLEVLLNPNDYAELSFRVALNYAYLGNPADRRNRYENVRDVQKIRNRVIHGGLNLKSRDASQIHGHAELAKKCLRDSITKFLTDSVLSEGTKLDADFWLDRILPPNAP